LFTWSERRADTVGELYLPVLAIVLAQHVEPLFAVPDDLPLAGRELVRLIQITPARLADYAAIVAGGAACLASRPLMHARLRIALAIWSWRAVDAPA